MASGRRSQLAALVAAAAFLVNAVRVSDTPAAEPEIEETTGAALAEIDSSSSNFSGWIASSLRRYATTQRSFGQGLLDSCYFLSAIVAIGTHHPDLITGLFTDTSDNILTTSWWLFGQKADVAMDMRLPANEYTGRTKFTSPKNSQFIMPMLEKAWAKLFGSYKAIGQGQSALVFKAITQGARVSLIQDPKSMNKDQLWNRLRSAFMQKHPMTCTSHSKKADQTLSVPVAHGYAIVNVGPFGGRAKCVQIHDPWGTDETGSVIPDNKKDGSYWLTLDEFIANYRRILIAEVRSGYRGWSSFPMVLQNGPGYNFGVTSYKGVTSTMALEFNMPTNDPFQVSMNWPRDLNFNQHGLMDACKTQNWAPLVGEFKLDIIRPDNSMYTVGKLASWNPSKSYNANMIVDMNGKAGRYLVYAKLVFQKVNDTRELNVNVNVYAPQSVTIKKSSLTPERLLWKMKKSSLTELGSSATDAITSLDTNEHEDQGSDMEGAAALPNDHPNSWGNSCRETMARFQTLNNRQEVKNGTDSKFDDLQAFVNLNTDCRGAGASACRQSMGDYKWRSFAQFREMENDKRTLRLGCSMRYRLPWRNNSCVAELSECKSGQLPFTLKCPNKGSMAFPSPTIYGAKFMRSYECQSNCRQL